MNRSWPGDHRAKPGVTVALAVPILLLAAAITITVGPRGTGAGGGAPGTALGAPLPASHLLPTDVPSCTTQTFEGAPVCSAAQMVYDAADGYLLAQMVCVNTSAPVAFNSCTWKYQDGSWSEVVSPNGEQPPALLEDGFVWDAADGYVLLFGGVVYPSAHTFGSSWIYRDGVWTNETASPLFRFAQVQTVFDSSASEVLATFQLPVGSGAWNTYVYTYRAGVWTNVTESSPVPVGFPILAQVADDPTDHGVLYFGGIANHTGVQGNSSWLFVDGSWQAVTGPARPPVLFEPTLAYDSFDGYDLLVGGTLGICDANPCSFSSALWEFSRGVWKNVTSTTNGTIPHEAGGVMSSDPGTDSVIEGFGWVGYAGSGINTVYRLQANLYSYAAGTWTEVPNPSGAPAVSLALVAVLSAVVVGAAIGVVMFNRVRARGRTPPGN